MSYILRRVRPSALQNWIAVNAAGSLKATARESWRAYLQANGGTGKTLADLETSFVIAAGGTGGSPSEKWNSYLSAQSGSKVSEKVRNKYR